MSDTASWRLAPYITVSDATAAIAFYEAAFGATVRTKHLVPDGTKVMHADLDLHGATIFLCDDFPEFNDGKQRDPRAFGGSPVTLHIDVPDVDAVFARALEHGATVEMALEDQFWGGRYGQLIDPFGHRWSLQTPGERPSDEQLDAGARAALT